MNKQRYRTWLFGPGADDEQHGRMTTSQADVLILDYEDFTPPELKQKARDLTPRLLQRWREANIATAVRINSLEREGLIDLEAAIPARPDFVLYPMASTAEEMEKLDAEIGRLETKNALSGGSIKIVPVCETALGVADVRLLVKGSSRIAWALLGAEDSAADLQAERSCDGYELEYARRRFILECRAAGVEPIDAPCTFADIAGLSVEARNSMRLGYKCKSLVRPEHALPLNAILTPSPDDISRARSIVSAFEAARSLGKDRVLVDGLWVEVPTYRNALRLLKSTS
jgi:citrate lyase subunit beta/citryl-CoA lyase